MGREGIIIGGGASGLMAAISAAGAGASVTVLEHMPQPGKKLLSTGNGKCNLTNRFLDESCYRSQNPSFPMEVIGRFPVSRTLSFFRELGILTDDKNGYVYPASNQARTVLNGLLGRAEELNVRIVTDCPVSETGTEDGRLFAQTGRGRFFGDFLILAPGSKAAPKTGSDGSGYELARAFGHRILKPLPALTQLHCEGRFFKELSGIRLRAGAALYSLKPGGKERFLAADTGEVQLTDYGISGIPVFQISRYAALSLDTKERVRAVLDFFPSAGQKELGRMLREQRDYLKNRPASVFLDGFFPWQLAKVLLTQAGIRKDLPSGQITDEEISRLASLIKNFSAAVTAVSSFSQAQVCLGGVDTLQVKSETMESRLVPGLYFAGEILDVDGICGGYNLQWAWSSGWLAGRSAALKSRKKAGK
mgnify:FL=1